MVPKASKRQARPERILATFFDNRAGSTSLPLPTRRFWPAALAVGIFFTIFFAIAWGQIASMAGDKIENVFDLAVFLFRTCWLLGWSVAVFILGALTLFLFLYDESARLHNGRLIKVYHLGLLRILSAYDLSKIENLRMEEDKDLKAPDTARLFFDYRGVKESLGDTLKKGQAQELISTIQSAPLQIVPEFDLKPRGWDLQAWADRMAARKNPAREPESAPERAGSAGATRWDSPSSIALITANLIPLAGVLFLEWNLGEVMMLFWAESAVIGFYNILKLIKVGKWAALVTAPFFAGHYGGFMAGHFLFIYYMFIRGMQTKGPEEPVFATLLHLFGPLWPALLALFISHGISFIMNYLGRKEYLGMKSETQMGAPYGRIVIMHLLSFHSIMGTLAEPILERDKKRGGAIAVAMATTSDADAVQNRPAPSGKPHFWPSASLLLLGGLPSTPRRRALHPTQTWGFQNTHY